MGLFTPGYLREGKGVRKDEPKKKGIKRLFEILARDFGDLIKLNFIFIISCIPIVTIGPAIVALSAVMTKRVRDIPCYVFHEYKKAFKENFKRAFVAGIVVTGLMFFSGYSLVSYFAWHGSTGNMLYFVLASVTMVIFVLLSIASCYLYTQIAIIELPLMQIIKNSLLLTIGFLPRSGLILVTAGALWAVFLVIPYPFIPLCLLVYHFSFTNLLVNMNVWPVLEKVFITNAQLAEEETESASVDVTEYSEQNHDAEQ